MEQQSKYPSPYGLDGKPSTPQQTQCHPKSNPLAAKKAETPLTVTTPAHLTAAFTSYTLGPFLELKYTTVAMWKHRTIGTYPNAAAKYISYGSIIIIIIVHESHTFASTSTPHDNSNSGWGLCGVVHAAEGVVKVGVSELVGMEVKVNCVKMIDKGRRYKKEVKREGLRF
ncbi:MAG: hypothetical protein M1834_005172 [Cirrosporium novae-zelandiae]|nr:MAG: hypothetical protein M1834_005172 [Cirrosporium novae-zelandiae]